MKLKVLVVDDAAVYRESFCQLLASCCPRITIVQAADGSTALSLSERMTFDLIILDYQLTSLTGGDVVRILRQRATASGVTLPPIVMMSTQPDIAIFARTMGANAFLNKPVQAEDINIVIKPLLPQAAQRGESTGSLLWRVQPRSRG